MIGSTSRENRLMEEEGEDTNILIETKDDINSTCTSLSAGVASCGQRQRMMETWETRMFLLSNEATKNEHIAKFVEKPNVQYIEFKGCSSFPAVCL